MRKLGFILSTFVLVVFTIPVLAIAILPESRIFVPEAFGVVCSEQNICLDDSNKLGAAENLLQRSLDDLNNQYGLSVEEPKIIFCSTDQCKSNFGLGKKAGYCIGNYGIVIAPRAWEPHYIKHELIHYWQAETFGNMALYSGKRWFMEGMAYSLSGDPRTTLTEPWESYRRKFDEWYLKFKTGPYSFDPKNMKP